MLFCEDNDSYIMLYEMIAGIDGILKPHDFISEIAAFLAKDSRNNLIKYEGRDKRSGKSQSVFREFLDILTEDEQKENSDIKRQRNV